MTAVAPPSEDRFDPAAERARVTTALLRSAGRLIMGRDERSIVAAVCRTLTQASPHR